MSAGRTNFFPKDTGWWRRERIVEAGLKHGTLATSVMDWLTCEAKAQNPKPVSDGYLKTGYVAIAHGATFGHNSQQEVREVVATLVEVGLLDDFEETGMTFTCRISGWKKDVVDKLEAQRKRESRAAADTQDASGHSRTNADVEPERPGPSSTGEESTGDTSSLRSEKARPRTIKFGGKPVPDPLLAAAQLVLAGFNRRAGTGYRPFGADGKPSENLKRVIGAMLRDERLTAEVAERMIDRALGDPQPFWGDSTPHLGHVFAPNVVEANLEAALRASMAGPVLASDAFVLRQQQRRQQEGESA